MDRLERPKPDLVEFASGFWDLRHFAAIDGRFGLPLDTEVSEERLFWYARRLIQAFSDIATLFPSTLILWRPLYTTPQFGWAHPVRAAVIEQLARQAVTALNESSSFAAAEASLLRGLREGSSGAGERDRTARPRRSGKAFAGRLKSPEKGSKAGFLKLVKERIGTWDRLHNAQQPAGSGKSIRGLLRINEWSTVLRGRERLEANPGSFVWADILLFE